MSAYMRRSRSTSVVHKAYHNLQRAIEEAQRLWTIGLQDRCGDPGVIDRRDDEHVNALMYLLFNGEKAWMWPPESELKEKQIWVVRVMLE